MKSVVFKVFELPPALAGEKEMSVKLAFAKKNAVLAKAVSHNSNLLLQLKLEAI